MPTGLPRTTLLVSGTAEIVSAPASPTTDQSRPDEALGPQDGLCNSNTSDIEQHALLRHEEAPSSPSGDIQDMDQSEYQYRPMTPGEEEIMRIYEDGIYRPPDMIEIPGGLQIKRSEMDEAACCRQLSITSL